MKTKTTQKVINEAYRLGMTRAAIAKLCGVRLATVTDWSKGRADPLATIAPLLRALDLLDGLD